MEYLYCTQVLFKYPTPLYRP